MAAKVIDRKMIVQLNVLDKLDQEIRVLERLKHPGIANMEKIIYLEDVIIITMELGSNGVLFDYVVAKYRLCEAEVRRMLITLLETLDYCHSRGICHRDIKLHNIVLTEKFEPKLIDFGLCYQAADHLRTTFCGTLEYIAPEVLRGGQYDGRKIDIWSLGICVYEMLVGINPFVQGTEENIYKAILEYDTLPMPNRPILSYSMQCILQSMLSRDPAARPSAREILNFIYTNVERPKPPPIKKPMLSSPSSAILQINHRPRKCVFKSILQVRSNKLTNKSSSLDMSA